MRRLKSSLADEHRRFLWVLVFWTVALVSLGTPIAILIGLLALLRHWDSFVAFLKAAFRNEWPYNVLGALGAVIFYFLVLWSSIAANLSVASITGFPASSFPSATTALASIVLFFGVFAAFTVIAGLAASVTGFFRGDARFAFPVAFMITLPALILLLGRQPGWRLHATEDLIVDLSFNHNSPFETGHYATMGGEREFGTKFCHGLPYAMLLAPDPQGGYIAAVSRKKPARLEAPRYAMTSQVMATQYVYKHIDPKACPTVNEYVEKAAPAAEKNR